MVEGMAMAVVVETQPEPEPVVPEVVPDPPSEVQLMIP